MSLRFLADHCISRSIIQSLENEGHTVYRLKDHIPADSPDKEVILKAQGLDAILISLDGDFADIVRSTGLLQGHCCATITKSFRNLSPAYYKGKLLLVEVNRIRVRG